MQSLKTCSKCKFEKDESEFYKRILPSGKKGLISWCKDCKHNYEQTNECKQKRIKYLQSEKGKETQKEYRQTKKAKDYQKTYRQSLSRKEYIKKYRQTETYKKSQKKYQKVRRDSDINYKIRCYLSNRLNRFIKKNQKSGHTEELLDCSVDFLKKHLESQFNDGMTWDNYGTGWNGKGMQEWHIDHIKPLASFDLENSKEQHKACHYTNLQPLWAKDNLSKSAKYKM